MTRIPADRQNWKNIIGLSLGLALLVSTMLIAFGLPAVNTAPRDLPVALSAPPQVSQAIATRLETAQPGALEIVSVPSQQAAEELIRTREVYGAFAVGPDGLTINVASAASPTVAQMLTQIGQTMAAQQNMPAHINDVIPTSQDDPKALGLAAGALPIALGGLIAGLVTAQLIRGKLNRLYAISSCAVMAGLLIALILEFWFGTFTGSFWATASAATLGILATGLLVLGSKSMFGKAGIITTAALIVLLGNPLSGLASAPELLPQPWGAIGQLLPPGATGTLLRNVAFFDGAAIATPLIVLTCWVLIGGAMLMFAKPTPPRRAEAQQ
ncbi:hypothetical protein [Timonella sp. A28]|uniref:hypothetical protein n=1 Tax=Timonella sp. A28 TaxID=3442640 RepID=UPI003EB6FAF4